MCLVLFLYNVKPFIYYVLKLPNLITVQRVLIRFSVALIASFFVTQLLAFARKRTFNFEFLTKNHYFLVLGLVVRLRTIGTRVQIIVVSITLSSISHRT